MKHKEKVEYLERDLMSRGIKKAWASTFVHRLLWRFGFNIPPPLFNRFWTRHLSASIGFWIVFQAGFWASTGTLEGVSNLWFFIAAMALGVGIALPDERKKKELRLPSWEEYPKKD